MSRRELALLVALLAIAVAALVRVGPADEPAAPDPPTTTILEVRPEEVSRIEISGAPETVVLERRPEGWRLSDPSVDEADADEVSRFLDAVRHAGVRRLVDDGTADLAEYGLDLPVRRLLLTVEGRPDPIELRLGRSSPIGSQRYLSREDRSVVLVDGSVGTALERTAASFREMRLFPLASGVVRRIEIVDPLSRLILERRGSDWWVQAPYVDRASAELVEGIARTVSSIRFVELETKPARRLGAAHRVTVWGVEASDERTAEISVGAAAGTRLARRLPGAVLGSVYDDAARQFEGDPEALRERRLAAFLSTDVRRLAWTMGDEGWIVTREGESAPWMLRRRSSGQEERADPEKVVRLLDRLRGLTLAVPRVVGGRGSSTTRVAVDGETGAIVAIGLGPIEGGGTWAESTWRPGIVGTVESRGLEALLQAAIELAP